MIGFGAAAVAGIAAFSTNVLSIRDNFHKMSQSEPTTLVLHDASATAFGGSLHVDVILTRTGPSNTPLSCAGEAQSEFDVYQSGFGAGPYEGVLSGVGDQALSMNLTPPHLEINNPSNINFHLNCGTIVTPWIPIKVTTLPAAKN